jgi:hypothetical protein
LDVERKGCDDGLEAAIEPSTEDMGNTTTDQCDRSGFPGYLVDLESDVGVAADFEKSFEKGMLLGGKDSMDVMHMCKIRLARAEALECCQ